MSDAACRNCGAEATDLYCPSCGQETSLALPTARQFLREAAGRYVALDGRLWRSLFALLARPGFLTREYFAGRRRRYVRPARLFLVLSLALFAMLRFTTDAPVVTGASGADAAARGVARPDGAVEIHVGDELGRLSPELGRRLQRFRQLPRQEKAEQLSAGALRYGPYAMFALLPGFALLLKIVYVGRHRYPNRPRRYSEHLVFAAHSHAFACLVAMLAVASPWPAARTMLVLWAIAYFAWSMRAVYGGRWSGVLVRGFVVAIAYTVLFAFAIAGLIVAAAVLR